MIVYVCIYIYICILCRRPAAGSVRDACLIVYVYSLIHNMCVVLK